MDNESEREDQNGERVTEMDGERDSERGGKWREGER